MMKYLFFLFFISNALAAQNYYYAIDGNEEKQKEVGYRGYTIVASESEVSELQDIKDQNANLVRWMIYYTWTWNDDTDFGEYQEWIGRELEKLDLALEECERLGIKLVIDLHDVPGGRYPDQSNRLFYNKTYNDQYVEIWKELAARYNSHPALYGYGLMNEPVITQDLPVIYDHIETQSRAAAAIREIDPNTALLFASAVGNGPNPFFSDPVPFDNVIYEVHMYDFHEYTHQGVLPNFQSLRTYPGYVDAWDETYTKDVMKEILKKVRDFQVSNNARILVGEFSVVRYAGGAARYLKDCIDIFEEYGWDWAYHGWGSNQYWSLEYLNGTFGDAPILSGSPGDRKLVILNGFKAN